MKQALLIACILLFFGFDVSAQMQYCAEDQSAMLEYSRVRNDAQQTLAVKNAREWWLGTLRDLDYGRRASMVVPNLPFYGQKVGIALPRGFKQLPLNERLSWQRSIEAAAKKVWSTAESANPATLKATIDLMDQNLRQLDQKVRDRKCLADKEPAALDVSGTWMGSNNIQYVIRQTGKSFTWNLPQYRENANGTIEGATVTARWSGNLSTGSASGKITASNNGRATRIVWSNGIVFTRN